MSDHLKPIIEALIFASPEPITPKTLYKLLDGEPKEDVDAALAAVRADYDRPCGLQIVEVAGGFQVTTKPELHEWVRKLFHERTTSKLSVQSLETLAVIAYKQPVTAPEIAEIRGVSSSSGVLQTLIERKLVKTVGRKQVVGRPFMYGTTREFLERFGLNDISDLPKVDELSDALGFELPAGLAEPTVTTSPLPFDAAPSRRSGCGARGPVEDGNRSLRRTRSTLRHKGHEAHKDHKGFWDFFVGFVIFVIFVPEREPWAVQARGPYFSTFSVTSTLRVSPLRGSVADAYCAVWPSFSRMLKLDVKFRNAGIPLSVGPDSFGSKLNDESFSLISRREGSVGLTRGLAVDVRADVLVAVRR